MSLRQYWRDVKHRFRHMMFEDFPAEGVEAAEKYAKAAYACCVAWYGPPLDPQRPYLITQSSEGTSFCRLMLSRYYLAISKEESTPERLCSVIAHEMYHRVTAGRKGLAAEMWVQEVMACLTSHWVLENQGFEKYADHAKRYWLSMMEKADVGAIRACRRGKSRDWIFRGLSTYPEGFGDTAVRTGFALAGLVDGNDLCRIVQAATLDEWIASLPEEKQYGVCHVLELAPDGKKVPETTQDIRQFLKALAAKGDKAVVVAELSKIARLQPSNVTAFFYLGYSCQVAERPEDALCAYVKAKELDCADKWLSYNIGLVYWKTKDYAPSAEWFQRAVEQSPEWAQPYYSLGRSLNALGERGAARRSWEKVLTLGDEHYANLAQKALEENPLPEEAAQD